MTIPKTWCQKQKHKEALEFGTLPFLQRTSAHVSKLKNNKQPCVESAAKKSHRGVCTAWNAEKWAGIADDQSIRHGRVREVQDVVRECQPQWDRITVVSDCLHALQALAVKHELPWRVVPFGSQVSGLALNDSDLDITCLPLCGAYQDSHAESCSNLRTFSETLRTSPDFEIVDLVFGAKVPILRTRYRRVVDIDVSIGNFKAVQNTQLLTEYACTDSKIRGLCHAIKLWAKACEVCGAVQGNLSLYSFSLMAIYYLQVDPQVQLPSLQHLGFKPGPTEAHSPPVVEFSSELSLSSLVVRFFHFYSDIFAWGSEVVSVRLGYRENTNSATFAKLTRRTSGRFQIEDPCEVSRNLTCVLAAGEEFRLRSAMQEAVHTIKDKGALPGLSFSRTVQAVSQESSPLFQPQDKNLVCSAWTVHAGHIVVMEEKLQELHLSTIRNEIKPNSAENKPRISLKEEKANDRMICPNPQKRKVSHVMLDSSWQGGKSEAWSLARTGPNLNRRSSGPDETEDEMDEACTSHRVSCAFAAWCMLYSVYAILKGCRVQLLLASILVSALFIVVAILEVEGGPLAVPRCHRGGNGEQQKRQLLQMLVLAAVSLGTLAISSTSPCIAGAASFPMSFSGQALLRELAFATAIPAMGTTFAALTVRP